MYCRNKLLAIVVTMIAALATSCGGGSNTEPSETPLPQDTAQTADNIEIEETVDTNTINLGLSLDELYSKLSEHRFVRFASFKKEHADEWQVCNDIYGARLLTTECNQTEVLDSLIEYRVAEYVKLQKMNPLVSMKLNYDQMEEFVERFKPTDQQDIDADEEQILPKLESDFELFISSYYQRMLKNMPDNKKLHKALKDEHMAWKTFARCERRLFKELHDGNAPVYESAKISTMLNQEKTKADVDLYYTLTNSNNYFVDDYEKIPEQFFFDVYNGFIKDIKETHKIGIGPKIQSLLKEQKAWQSYIYARTMISNRLTGNQKVTYDNVTRRMQKTHLVHLLNRFEGYGYCSNDFKSSLLADTCTYTAMYKYVPMQLGTQF